MNNNFLVRLDTSFQLFLARWQRKLCFQSFFHVYRHSKIQDIDTFDEVIN